MLSPAGQAIQLSDPSSLRQVGSEVVVAPGPAGAVGPGVVGCSGSLGSGCAANCLFSASSAALTYASSLEPI